MCKTDQIAIRSSNGEVKYLNKQQLTSTKSASDVRGARLNHREKPLGADSAPLSNYKVKPRYALQEVGKADRGFNMCKTDQVAVRSSKVEVAYFNDKQLLARTEPWELKMFESEKFPKSASNLKERRLTHEDKLLKVHSAPLVMARSLVQMVRKVDGGNMCRTDQLVICSIYGEVAYFENMQLLACTTVLELKIYALKKFPKSASNVEEVSLIHGSRKLDIDSALLSYYGVMACSVIQMARKVNGG